MGAREDFASSELAPVLVYGESVLDDIARQKTERETLSDKQEQAKTALVNAREEQKEADAAKVEWQEKWDNALAVLGLKNKILPSEALDLLETIEEIMDKLGKAKDFQSRIDGIDRDANKFKDDVLTLLEQSSPDLKKLSPDQAALQLYDMLGKARQDKEFLKKNKEEIEALAAEA